MNYFEHDCFRYNVLLELSPVELEKHYKEKTSPFYSNLRDKHFLTLLCEKWNLGNVDKFEDFLDEWNLNYMFSRHTTLEYQLENYRKYFTVSKAAGLASRNSCEPFCQSILEEYSDNHAINTKIHKNYLKRENALELVASIDEEDRHDILPKALRMGYEFKDLFPDKNIRDYRKEYTEDIIIADIIFRRPITFPRQRVDIIDIAVMLKTPDVFSDPYYLNHPMVNTEWKNSFDVYRNCHQLVRFLSSEWHKEEELFIELEKKLCDVFDEIGLPRNANIRYHDVYSLEWMKKNCSKYGYLPPIVYITRRHNRTEVDIQTKNNKRNFGFSEFSDWQICPSFLAYILEEY